MLLASDENTALAVDVIPGQAHDAPRLKPLLQRTVARLKSPATTQPPAAEVQPAAAEVQPVAAKPPRPPVEGLAGDKAFGGEPQRQACTKLVSPPKVNARDPIPLNEEAYRQRNRIEPPLRQTEGVSPGGDPP